MVRIDVVIREKVLVHLHARGHAESGPYGKDIVCASVSLLLNAVCRSIEITPGIEISGGAEKEGDLLLDIAMVPREHKDEIRGITKVFLLGAEQLQREFPDGVSLHIDTLEADKG